MTPQLRTGLTAAAALPLPDLDSCHSPADSYTAEDEPPGLPERGTDAESSVKTGGRFTLQRPDSDSSSAPSAVTDSSRSGSDCSESDAERGSDGEASSFQAAQDAASAGEAGS